MLRGFIRFRALVIWQPNRVRRVIFSPLTFLVAPHIFTLFHKMHDFRGKVLGYKIYVLIFIYKFD